MERPAGFLRRYGLAMLLTASMAALFVSTTLPAIHGKREIDLERALRQAEREQLESTVTRQQGWLDGLNEDPWVQKRLYELKRLSPDVVGPRTVPPEPVGGDGSESEL